jgi:hypothetical protein
VLTIIENGSKEWAVIAVEDELRIYSREEPGEWTELPVGDESEQVDPEKSFMLEELYGQRAGDDGDEEEEEAPEEDLGEEEEGDVEEEPELAEDEPEEDEEPEDEEPEEEAEKPARRRSKSAAKR